jgi:hypothetical protein
VAVAIALEVPLRRYAPIKVVVDVQNPKIVVGSVAELRELIAEESGDATILGAGYNIDTPRVEYPDRGVLASGQMFGVVYAEFTATITEGRT